MEAEEAQAQAEEPEEIGSESQEVSHFLVIILL